MIKSGPGTRIEILPNTDFFASKKKLIHYLNNVFLADIDPYFLELIRKLSCSKYDVASSGTELNTNSLPSTGLELTDWANYGLRNYILETIELWLSLKFVL